MSRTRKWIFALLLIFAGFVLAQGASESSTTTIEAAPAPAPSAQSETPDPADGAEVSSDRKKYDAAWWMTWNGFPEEDRAVMCQTFEADPVSFVEYMHDLWYEQDAPFDIEQDWIGQNIAKSCA